MNVQSKLETERLLLENLAANDHKFILELLNTEGWLKFIGDRNVHSEADAIAYVQRIMGNPNLNYWVVRLESDKTALGIITFIKRDYLEHPDIGFAFLPKYSSKVIWTPRFVNDSIPWHYRLSKSNHIFG